ncbi:hypothetical protein FB451DRAFT_1272758 [Mycena latifolia]|nr:hypothetical protein FB451DRAFT_1272758 [Mycena latifolia]
MPSYLPCVGTISIALSPLVTHLTLPPTDAHLPLGQLPLSLVGLPLLRRAQLRSSPTLTTSEAVSTAMMIPFGRAPREFSVPQCPAGSRNPRHPGQNFSQPHLPLPVGGAAHMEDHNRARPNQNHTTAWPAPPQMPAFPHNTRDNMQGQAAAWMPTGGPPAIHPWGDGYAPSPTFHFDLAPATFRPRRLVAVHPAESAPLTEAELRVPAFDPPSRALRILHRRLPFGPIHVVLPGAPAGPLSLGDVLTALHRALHAPITRTDWEMLDREGSWRVVRAFRQRCRAEGGQDREIMELKGGLKRVDFLLGETVFVGLVRAAGDPLGYARLVTAA